MIYSAWNEYNYSADIYTENPFETLEFLFSWREIFISHERLQVISVSRVNEMCCV